MYLALVVMTLGAIGMTYQQFVLFSLTLDFFRVTACAEHYRAQYAPAEPECY